MIVTPMSLATFFDTISQRAEKEGYNWIISLIGRYADAENVYDEIEKTWASLNDLTNDRIAFVFSSFVRTMNNDFYRTPHKEPYVGSMCPFASVLGASRFEDNHGNFEHYYEEFEKVNWKELHTQSITEFIRKHNIDEQALPGIFIYELRTKQNVFVHIDSDEKIYKCIKSFVIESGKLDDDIKNASVELTRCEHRSVFELENHLFDMANAQSTRVKNAIINVINGSSTYKQNKEIITDKMIRKNLKKLGQWKRQHGISDDSYVEKKKDYEIAKENYDKSISNIKVFLNGFNTMKFETQNNLTGKIAEITFDNREEKELADCEKITTVFLADEWGFSKGGINVFNRLLCEAMGTIEAVKVLCVSTNVDEDEIAMAAKGGIQLVNISGRDFLKASSIISALKKYINIEYKNIVFIGHDIKTGDIALKCKDELLGSKCAIIHHMAYAEYYSIVNRDSGLSENKEQEQRRILQSADIIFANGPVLEKSAQDIVGNKVPVVRILPGIADVEPRVQVNNSFKVVTFGRIEQGEGLKRNNSIIKQTYLAVAAWADFTNKYIQNQETMMKIYGKNENDDSVDSDMDQLVKEYSSSVYAISVVKYEEDRNKLLEVLSEFSLCLVLSLREGFGLTALEAISAGVPLIVSKRSGFYKALEDFRLESYVQGVDIQGKPEYPFYSEDDLKNVSKAMYHIFINQRDVKSRAIELRKKLLEAGFTWPQCAETILSNITFNDSNGVIEAE